MISRRVSPWVSLLFALLISIPAFAQEKAVEPQVAPRASASAREEPASKLPVKRVVLYKNGVGYFEHLGRVRGNQDVTIDFTSGQLNDVLKSLTVLDLGQGRIAGVSYNSDAPLGRRLGALRLPLGERTTLIEFLGALRGARLDVRNGVTSLSGRLLSVERKSRPLKEGVTYVDEISLVTDAGEVRTMEVTPATSVRIAERDLNEQVRRYMSLVASQRDQDLRRMVVSTAGSGERPLYVSYISEVPIWKTTYRIVLPSRKESKPLLQGWAIVDNTVGEDWENVELSLVAGAPQSFIQQLSQPYYSRRPVVPLPESVMLTPQTHQATLIPGTGTLTGQVTDPTGAVIPNATVRVYDESNNLIAETQTDDDGDYEFESLPVGNHRVEVTQPGFQKMVFGGVNVMANAANTQNARLNVGAVESAVVVESANSSFSKAAPGRSSFRAGRVGGGIGGGFASAAPAAMPMASPAEARDRLGAGANAQELGDLFEYKLKEKITIRKNQSALVPIVQTPITAEKISLWNAASGSARPQRVLWLTNSSNLTLDGGSFSVLEDETFAGEGIVEPMKPAERRLLSYAVDLSMLVDAKQESEQQRVTRVRINRGVMIQTRELRETKTYTVRNEDSAARTAIIEHTARPGWKLLGDLKPEETTSSWLRFRVTVEPKRTATLVVREARPLDQTYALTSIDDTQVSVFLRVGSINKEIEDALRRIIAQRNVVAGLSTEISSRSQQVQRIFEDQSRVRENMKALKGSSEEKALLQRYTQQLNELENRLDALRKEIADLEAKRAAAQAELDKMIQDLTMDVNL
jgi:hypothetical protein